MKKGSYLTIQDWMVTDLHLKGNELLAYALIYGFSQDEQSCFYGSYQYVMEWLSVDKTTAVRVLRNLENKGLLRKWQEKEGNVIVNRYATNTAPACPAAPSLNESFKRCDIALIFPIHQIVRSI